MALVGASGGGGSQQTEEHRTARANGEGKDSTWRGTEFSDPRSASHLGRRGLGRREGGPDSEAGAAPAGPTCC
jgi:hypothetical protein